MSTDDLNSAPPSSDAGSVADELPPVTPPSAGFIVQLFLIPAMIVAAVIGVWALFGQLASSEINVDRLVQELGSSNEHRRWRSALELSQVLKNERIALPTDGQLLSERRDIAEALTGLLQESLELDVVEDDDVKHQEFLARTMGSLNVDDVVLPVLARAISPNNDTGVRRSALMSSILIAGRHFASETGTDHDTSQQATVDFAPVEDDAKLPLTEPTISDNELLSEIRGAAQDPDAAIRHLAAYAFGLISGPKSIEQLRVLLLDADKVTQANAAIALARNADTSGSKVLLKLIEQGTDPMEAKEFAGLSAEDQQAELAAQLFDQSATLVNCMTAVGRLWARIPAEQQQAFLTAIRQLSGSHASSGVRLHATNLLRSIE